MPPKAKLFIALAIIPGLTMLALGYCTGSRLIRCASHLLVARFGGLHIESTAAGSRARCR